MKTIWSPLLTSQPTVCWNISMSELWNKSKGTKSLGFHVRAHLHRSNWFSAFVRRLTLSAVLFRFSVPTCEIPVVVIGHCYQHVRPLDFCYCWYICLERSSRLCLQSECHWSCFWAPAKNIFLFAEYLRIKTHWKCNGDALYKCTQWHWHWL